MPNIYSSLPVRIAGTGRALPKTLVLSEDLDRKFGHPQGYFAQVSGTHARYICMEETQIDLAVEASVNALQRAQLVAKDIGMVLGACGIPYQTLPATAPLVMLRLGIGDGQAAAFDVNSTCLSFLNALDLAAWKVASGEYHNVLVFSSEVASRALPWKDQPEVAALFGDGAAAVVVTASQSSDTGIRASMMRSYPSAYDACQIGAGGTRIDFHKDPKTFAINAVFRMDGKELFRVVSKHFPAFVEDLLGKAGWARDEVDIVVPHQASNHALILMARQTGFSENKIVNICAEFGNQIAASIPTALDIALRDGRIGPGCKVLMLGASAGVSLGGMAIEV